MTRRIWRALLAVAAVQVVTIAVLWAGWDAAVWLAVHATGATATQAITGLALAVVLVILARAVDLLLETTREPVE